MSRHVHRASRPMPEWCADCGEIARLLRWLDAHDEYGPLEVPEAIDVVAKPWNWDKEFQEMCAEQTESNMQRPDLEIT